MTISTGIPYQSTTGQRNSSKALAPQVRSPLVKAMTAQTVGIPSEAEMPMA
ncbi:hypothetical protein J4H86_09470 [Spiractinospora alimapuensis]|uniref:hypothetical protein n=1 Tax=Spiractinospora alimapuensis TaxID=2820884 RepID=UPI001F370454|nr:hypothetical protein [Spiractinospora alimapuensis]QVQ53912.1 hypothetical protein J4H86_09470 [Spiractinospora alimapuensis]